MSSLVSLLWFCISFTLVLVAWVILRNRSSTTSQPPGPPSWPLIGNILDVGMMPHQNLYKLRAKYGPVIWLKLGMSNTLVVQSAKAAEELFKKHDLPFSDRRVPNSFMACDHDKGSLALARYGEYWRVIRKLSLSELFTPKRITSSAPVRQSCINAMIQWIKEDSAMSRANGGSGEIQLDKYLCHMTFNLVSNFTMSKDIMSSKSDKGNEFYEAMNNFMEWNGVPNLVDSFPFLEFIDPQGIGRNTKKYYMRLMNIVAGCVKERILQNAHGKKNKNKDFLDSLLEFTGKGEVDNLSEKNVICIVLEMFLAGTETTSSTILWGMAELLHKPGILRKIHYEIEELIGYSRNVEEGDLNDMPYLQAVVKEIMRLHPSLPFLLPRNAMQDTVFMGYQIPKNTMVLVNAWAIHRDPDSWKDPLSFYPERFINSNINYKGQHFELIPFGSGRRSCIGMLLGNKMVGLTIARLVQCFDWKLPSDESPDSLDMTEVVGIALRKQVPLVAIPFERKF